ncbi:MAG: BppU family phage baseplate upper protein, partial [Enterococcus devriesei]
ATQTEAEAGTDNSKSMTPLGTAQQIEKKAVTVASNQTIGGIKNFKDGLMVNGDNIVGINDRSLLSISPTNVSIFADGSGTFIKHGAMVIVQGSVKFKQAVSYGSLITNALPTEFSATFNNGIIVGHSTSNSAKSMYVERGTTNIKANSNFDANEWFTFNGIYWTGEGE